VNRKAVITFIAIVLLVVSVSLLLFHEAVTLPWFRLKDGGELRVLKVCYGTEDDHHLGRAPKTLFWLWNRLPKSLQVVVPYPEEGVDGISPFPHHPAISIWWAWIEPTTHQRMLCPSGDVVMTLDSGEKIQFGWPIPCDGVRQIFIPYPPRNSKRLQFQVPVNYEQVEFAIDNPAFKR
jgi:hypothetical protein